MRAQLYKWHRKLAVVAGTLTLLWACSGLLHPFMSYWGPRPAAFMPPENWFYVAPGSQGLAVMLKEHAGERVYSLRLVKANYHWAWQVKDKNGFRYYDAATGQDLHEFGAEYSASLAHYYAGPDAKIAAIATQKDFDPTYPRINRLLPVDRVDLTDGRTVYVDPGSDRMGGITDPVRRVALKIFQTVHTLSFLEPVEAARVMIIFFSVTTILVMGVLGTALRATMKYRVHAQAARRWHGLMAYALWIPVLMFTLSGLFHLVMQSTLTHDNSLPQPREFTLAADIHLPDLNAHYQDLRLVTAGGTPVWMIRSVQDVRFAAADGTPRSDTVQDFVRGLVPDADPQPPDLVKMYNDEYGFAAKRLPVWRFTRGDEILFVDPVDIVISSSVDRTQVSEQWLFTRLHKWQFLDGVTGKRWRDAALAAIALCVVALAVTGLRLSLNRKT